MSDIKYHTTESYAELHGLTVGQVRYACLHDNLEYKAIASAGHGTYLIPEDAVIQSKKVGRKVGYKVKTTKKKRD
jgi:hypothetical protein